MANRRMISKSISTSKKLAKVSLLAKIIYTWTIPHTDDYGRMDGDAESIKAVVIPRIDESITTIEKALIQLETFCLIKRYKVENEVYLMILEFDKFQTFKSDRPKLEQFPAQLVDNGEQKLPLVTKDNQRLPLSTIVRDKLSKVKLSKVKRREDNISSYGEFSNVKLTLLEFQKLNITYGSSNIKNLIVELDGYIESSGRRYKSYYATIQNWTRRNGIKKIEKITSTKMPTISDEQRKKNIVRLKDMKKDLNIG